jgi:hypothetical protein
VADPTRFIIRQEVLWFPPGPYLQPTVPAETPVLFTATYRFNYPDGLSPDTFHKHLLASAEPISDAESSPMLCAFSPFHDSEKESVSWCETPPPQDLEVYFDVASYCDDNYVPPSYDWCRRDFGSIHSSPFSLGQRHLSPNAPASPSSLCFPAELSNHASSLIPSFFASAN